MSKPRDNRQKDLLRPAPDDIIDPGHALVRLAGELPERLSVRRHLPTARHRRRVHAAKGQHDRHADASGRDQPNPWPAERTPSSSWTERVGTRPTG